MSTKCSAQPAVMRYAVSSGALISRQLTLAVDKEAGSEVIDRQVREKKNRIRKNALSGRESDDQEQY